MTKYTYVLKADRPKYRDGTGWMNLDVPVTVVAEDYEAAKEEALRILSKPPSSSGWSFWTQSITPYEEPWPPPYTPDPYSLETVTQSAKKFRLRGVR